MRIRYWGWNQPGRPCMHRGALVQAVPEAVAVYTVEAGDNLWSIANNHGISVAELQKLNEDLFPRRPRCGVSSSKWRKSRAEDAIYPGDKLYLPRHAHHWNEQCGLEHQQDSLVDATLLQADRSQAATAAVGSSLVISQSELTPEPDGGNVDGSRFAAAAIGVIGLLALFQVGRAFSLVRDRAGRGKAPPELPPNELTNTEDIIAHTAEDANGSYITSGYAVPSKLHETAVLSTVTCQGSISQPYSTQAITAATLETSGVCDRDGDSAGTTYTTFDSVGVAQAQESGAGLGLANNMEQTSNTASAPSSRMSLCGSNSDSAPDDEVDDADGELDDHVDTGIDSMQNGQAETPDHDTPCLKLDRSDIVLEDSAEEQEFTQAGTEFQNAQSIEAATFSQSALDMEETGKQQFTKLDGSIISAGASAEGDGAYESQGQRQTGDTLHLEHSGSVTDLQDGSVELQDEHQASGGPAGSELESATPAYDSVGLELSKSVLTDKRYYDHDRSPESSQKESVSDDTQAHKTGSSPELSISVTDISRRTCQQRNDITKNQRESILTRESTSARHDMLREQGTSGLHNSAQDIAPHSVGMKSSTDEHSADPGSAKVAAARVANSPSIEGEHASDMDIELPLGNREHPHEVAQDPFSATTLSPASSSLPEQPDGQASKNPVTPAETKPSAPIPAGPPQVINPIDVLADFVTALYAAATKERNPGQDKENMDVVTSDERRDGSSAQSSGQWEEQDPIGSLTQMATIMAAAAGILTGGVAQSLLDMVASPRAETRRRDQGREAVSPQQPQNASVLEMRLLDLSYKTERGCKLTSTDRAEMEQIVVQLEALAQSHPAQVMDSVDGQWNLAMTDDQDILAIMDAVNAIPLVSLGEITQDISVKSGIVINNVQLAAPMPFNVSASVPWQIQRSRKPYQKFSGLRQGTHVSTPHLLAGLHAAVMERGVELLTMAPVSQLLQLLQETPSTRTSKQESATGFEGDQGWLNSFAHDTLRIARGPNNTVLVFTREASAVNFF